MPVAAARTEVVLELLGSGLSMQRTAERLAISRHPEGQVAVGMSSDAARRGSRSGHRLVMTFPRV
jgi:hypothetical protein